RPGEKLYEELMVDGETTQPTYHEKILISKVCDLDYSKIRTMIDELCISNLFSNENVVQMMKNIVPEYISNNSDYCKLDQLKSKKNPEEIPQREVSQINL